MPTNNESDEQVREKLASELAQWVNPAVTNPWVVADFILAREQKLREALENLIKVSLQVANRLQPVGPLTERLIRCAKEAQQALSTHNTTEDGKDES